MLSPLKGSALAFAPGRTPDLANVEGDVLQRWERVQKRFGKDLGINSGFRDPDRNANAGGAKKSQHMHGKALDIDVRDLPIEERKRLIEAASAEGFTGIGVYNNSLHFDTGPRRYWGPSYRSKSLPGWASGTIKAHMAGLYGDTKVADAGTITREQYLEEAKRRGLIKDDTGPTREQYLEEARRRGLIPNDASSPDAALIQEKAAVESAVGQVLGETPPSGDAPPVDTAPPDGAPMVEPFDLVGGIPGVSTGPTFVVNEIKKFLPKKWQDALDNVIKGSSLDFADELTGAANAVLDRREGESTMDAYARSRDWTRDQQKQFAKDYPLLALGTELAGGFAWAPVGGSVFGVGKTLPGMMARGMAEGAIFGSAYGAGKAEGNENIVPEMAGGLGLGLAAGAVFPPAARAVGWAAKKLGAPAARLFSNKRYYVPGQGLTDEGKRALKSLGYDAKEISDDLARQFSDRAAKMGNIPAGSAIRLDEQGIPVMLQNVTKNTDDWHFLERAIKGGGGGKVQKLMKELVDAQAEAVARRADAISRGFVDFDEPSRLKAAELALKGLLKNRDAMRKAGNEAYEKLGFTVADGRAAKYLPKVFDSMLKNGTDDIAPIAALDPIDTPIANRAMEFAKRIAERAEKEGRIPGKEVDRLRQILNRSASGQGNDIDALRLMRKGFDDWLDAAVSNGLFRGDPEHIAAMKEAPKLWRAYTSKFVGRDGNRQFIGKLVKDGASPKDVANMLWGMSNVGTSSMSDEKARFLKDILGESSKEWAAVKQGMFETLMKPTRGDSIGPKAISSNINGFFSHKNDTYDLARVLFSPEETRELLKFASAVKELVPPDGTVNYSNTAITLQMMMRDGGANAANAFLRRAGDAVIPGAGQVADVATRPVVESLVNRGDWLRAKAVAAGIPLELPKTSSVVPGVIALDALQAEDN